MSKLQVIDGKQTNWEGLWWHPEYNGFSSATISLSELRKFKGNVRLYVRKNMFFNKGENGRPNYRFCLKDSDSPTFRTLEIEDDDEMDVMQKIDELADVLRQGNRNADGKPVLPSVSQANADYLLEKAIELVEEITGEKWEFTYTYFG